MAEPFYSQSLTGFVYSEEYGAYVLHDYTGPFVLEPGKYYDVYWDDVRFGGIAVAFTSADGYDCIGIGNGAVTGGEDTGEPFGIVYNAELKYIHFFSSEDLEAHTVRIFLVEDGVLLKNYHGDDVAYGDVDMLLLNKPEGGTQVFSKGEVISGVTLELDLAEGDQTVYAPEGTLVESAIIKKPDTLIPENIRHGVGIAGVEGEYLGESEERTVDLEMATGNMVILPTEDGKTMSQVTVTKPATLVPGNILLGVNIGGVVGSYVGTGSGDGSLDDRLNKTIVSATGSATMLPSYAFHSCPSLKLASYPAATKISASAFYNCQQLSQISFPLVSNIGSFAFSWCTKLSSVAFPACTFIGSSAFICCSGLTDINFPECATVGYGAFSSCIKLTTVSFPKATTVSGYAFCNDSALLEADLPACSYLPNYAFGYCQSMHTLNAPLVTAMESYALYSCIKLKNVYMPKLTIAPSYAFRGCNLTGDVNFDSLTTAGIYGFFNAALSCIASDVFPVLATLSSDTFRACYGVSWAYLPAARTIGSRAFYGLYKMSWVSLPAATYFYSSAFFSCTHMKSLYLLGSSFATLQNSSVFSQTAMNLSTYIGEFGSIFVRESMLASYQTRAYWSYYSSRFVGLTDEEIAALEETT